MPAVITHYLFARDVYRALGDDALPSSEEFSAFLLGNQGPDVLFFSVLDVTQLVAKDLGTRMHRADAAKTLACMRDAANMLPDEIRPIGQAFAKGFLCHYLLDSSEHPFIYAQQNALIQAGVQGLDEDAAHEVHAEIESELDVLALSVKEGLTIEQFQPACALQSSKRVQEVISFMFKHVAAALFSTNIRQDAYISGVENYMTVLFALHSPSGLKREILGRTERLFRKHSFARAMSHRNELLHESIFDNHEHMPWTHPGTGEVSDEGFWQLYQSALDAAIREVPLLLTADEAHLDEVTSGYDFNGNPTRAQLISVD